MTRARTPAILVEGSTCWRIATADRIAVLIDSERYFAALLEALREARSRIMILGWDFAPGVRLDPRDESSELRLVLPALVAARESLHVHLLIWDIAPLYGPSPTGAAVLDRDWQEHPRIHFRFDGHHPPGAAHHEKIVCIDDALAFAGGIDLTNGRWDTRHHAPLQPGREDAEGEPCEPVHDLQMAVSGPAAAAVGECARARWAAAGGEPLAPCPPVAPLWPACVPAWPCEVALGIARTRPRMEDQQGVDEIAHLNLAALAAARRAVYIETQYFCAEQVADALAELLARDEPPEIVMLVWEEATGWLERFAMGSNRERMLRRLAAADHRKRLRVFKRVCAGVPEREVALHAKLVIVDDGFLRVGSSNLNNRSLGFDTECDLAVEAPDAATRAAIAGVRADLLAEHLDSTAGAVQAAIEAEGLVGAVDRLNRGARLLQPYRIDPEDGAQTPLPGSALLDPAEPLDLDYLRRLLRQPFLAS